MIMAHNESMIIFHLGGNVDHDLDDNDVCRACGGEGASLTTECRGIMLDEIMLKMVENRQADYVDGDWRVQLRRRSLKFNV